MSYQNAVQTLWSYGSAAARSDLDLHGLLNGMTLSTSQPITVTWQHHPRVWHKLLTPRAANQKQKPEELVILHRVRPVIQSITKPMKVD
jgi:hypothetical protein